MSLEPITREEKMLDAVTKGEAVDITPITREEMFLAKAGGASVEVPKPITRKEIFLNQIAENGSGGGASEGWIGDGKTHIWIRLEEGRTSPMLCCSPRLLGETVTVDWGDGTEKDIFQVTDTSVYLYTPTHNYAKPGDYIITLEYHGGCDFLEINGSTCLLRHSVESSNLNIVYANAIKKIEIGDSNSTVKKGAFSSCHSLESVSSRANVIWENAFYGCMGITNAHIQNGARVVTSSAFYNCNSLVNVSLPKSLARVQPNTFRNCFAMRCLDLTECTEVTTLESTNAFTGIPDDLEIRVPAALYDEWKAATNWATYADHIVAV